MAKIKNIFDWLTEITINKSPVDSFSDEDWKQWNSYMIHRFISMNQNYVEIANILQKFPPQNHKQIYLAYKDLIPKKKVWLRYIKGKTSKINEDLIEYISKYFSISSKEALSYINILDKEKIQQILIDMGVDKKEIKKLYK